MSKLEYPQKAHKPPKNHPWRKMVIKREITEFAKENSINPTINNFIKGGGLEPWNK